VTPSQSEGTKNSARRAWNLGVRARLLLAFFGIAAFAVLAAAAAIYAFHEVGNRLAVIDARVPPALSALELSRSAERIIAAAPALLAAADRPRRDDVKAELAAEVERLNGKLLELKNAGRQALPPGTMEPLVSSLTARLGELDGLVERRLETSERIGALRRDVLQTSAEVQRLLAPWLEIMGSEIAALVEAREAGSTSPDDQPRRLAPLIELQRLMRTAQAQVSTVVDMLAEASVTDQPRRLEILAFQLDLALGDLETMVAGLDPRLRPLFLEQVARLREVAEGPHAIFDARKQELALVREGEALLTETGRLSAQLTAAVDRLGIAARQDIGAAIRDALSVQQLSTRALIVVVALSLLTSILIVWRYVGGNIVRRLTALSNGMLAIADGRLRTPVAVQGTDEIAAMGRAVEVFRRNALELEQLLEERKETAARLEQLVEERTRDLSDKSRQLEIANKYKSHFLASASHDLRQPLHALNLFVAQLHTESDAAERHRLVDRIDAAVSSMNELFESLLDMAKLEAGILEPHLTEFPIEQAFKRIETTFADAARQKGLRLSVVPSRIRVRSDFVLLERILFNLVSNAVRYTARGGVVVGARRKGEQLRIDVCDTGPGIPQDQQRKVFDEFHQLAESDRHGGLGLGLAIVERLGRLLNHEVELDSRPGHGTRFSVSVPLIAERCSTAETPVSPPIADPARGKLVVVIDDDPLVLEGMGGILRSWGCRVLATDSEEAALARIAAHRPDLVIADYRLADGRTGIQAIKRLRERLGEAVPAFLISGDTAPERLRDASQQGFQLLHKPVAPMRLRAMLNQLLKAREAMPQ
jgi:signal transduction histidine kinase